MNGSQSCLEGKGIKGKARARASGSLCRQVVKEEGFIKQNWRNWKLLGRFIKSAKRREFSPKFRKAFFSRSKLFQIFLIRIYIE